MSLREDGGLRERAASRARPVRTVARGAAALWGRIPTDVRLLLLMLSALIPIRAIHTSHIRGMYVDGGYYAEVARHVRDGYGLSTNVSLYHSGYETFPHPTSVYPLWPWLLGMTSRLVDLEIAAHWMPFGFAILAAIGAFLFGRALWPEPIFPDHVPGLHAGHLFLIALSVHREFVMFTSLPYTEGISWALTFLFLWRVASKGADLGLLWAIETGVWLALLYFSRYQLIVAPMAATCAYAARLIFGPERGKLLLHASVALGVVYGLMFAWFLHIRTFIPGAGPSALLRFDQNRANDLLTPVDVIIENYGLFDLLIDRISGIFTAWDPVAEGSYHATFYTLHWALAAAVPLLLWAGVRRLRSVGLRGAIVLLARPEVARWWFISVFALGALLSVHAIHKHYYGAWYFTKRQGLISLLSFVLSLGWLLRLERIVPHLLPAVVNRAATVIGVLVLCPVLMIGTYTLLDEMSIGYGELRTGSRYEAIGEWLERQSKGELLVVAIDATLVQRIAWRTKHIGYHWIDSPTTYEDLLTITDTLGARYVVFRNKALTDEKWTLFETSKARFDQDFVQVPGRPEGYTVFRRRSAVKSPIVPVIPVAPFEVPPVEDSTRP